MKPDTLEPGFYKRRLRAGGAWVPVHIWFGPTPDPDDPNNPMDRSPCWQVEVNGELIDSAEHLDTWTHCAGNRISETEYFWMLTLKCWAERYKVGDPAGEPTARIDYNRMPPVI